MLVKKIGEITNGEFPIHMQTGAFIILLTGFTCTLINPLLFIRFGRKTIMLIGYSLMLTCSILAAVF